MVRISKQQERRQTSPKRCRAPAKKTGPKQDRLSCGYKVHENALSEAPAQLFFIPKIK